jgi:hypothetical protein
MKKRSRPQKTSFDADPQTLKSLKVVTITLGFGNQSMGIRRALCLVADMHRAGVLADLTTCKLTEKGENIK